MVAKAAAGYIPTLRAKVLQLFAGNSYQVVPTRRSAAGVVSGPNVNAELFAMYQAGLGLEDYAKMAETKELTEQGRQALATLTLNALSRIRENPILKEAIGDSVLRACFKGFQTCFPVAFLGMSDLDRDTLVKNSAVSMPIDARLEVKIGDEIRPLLLEAYRTKTSVSAGNYLVIPLVGHNEKEESVVEGLIGLVKTDGEVDENDKYIAKLFSSMTGEALYTARKMGDYYKKASTDSLTQLDNHGAAIQGLAHECSRALRYNENLSFIMADIDHFKYLNDSLGHPFGDEVLKAVAAAFRSAVRDSDLVGRYGGEEFCVVLPNTSKAEALTVAENIRIAVEAVLVKYDDKTSNVTISLGVASLTSGGEENDATSNVELLKKTDSYLYMAKKNGRNRTMTVLPNGQPATAEEAVNWYASQESEKRKGKAPEESDQVRKDQLKKD